MTHCTCHPWLCAPAVCVQLTRGMEKTVHHLVQHLKSISAEIRTDKDLANVASVSAGELRLKTVNGAGCGFKRYEMRTGKDPLLTWPLCLLVSSKLKSVNNGNPN